MPEISKEQLEELQNGGHIIIDVDIWHGDSYEGQEYKRTHSIPVAVEDDDND